MSLQRNKKSIGYYCFKLLGSRLRRRFLAWLVEKRHHSSPVVFSGDSSGLKKMVLIVPADPLDALLQIPTVMALCNRFGAGELWLLCSTQITPFFRTVEGVNQLIEYDDSDRCLFTSGCRRVRSQIMRLQFDSCLLLERQPDDAFLYWCGSSGARLRAGYYGAAEFPFVNLQVKASPGRRHIIQANRLLAEVLGCRGKGTQSWAVAKPLLAEIGHLLSETGISGGKPLIGIDIEYLLKTFSGSWVEQLIDRIRQSPAGVYLFSYGAPDKPAGAWIAACGLPLITNLAIAQTAALIMGTGVVVAGPSLMFVMAALLKRPAIGIVTDDERARFCDNVASVYPVVYSDRPDDAVVQAVETALAGIVGNRVG